MKLGDNLKHARESKELTIQAVADAIHLSPAQIAALESNQFALLPEPVTTRGFIRGYAKFLEIDSAPLLESYREQVPHQDPNSIVVASSLNKVIESRQQTPWLMYILGSLVVLLLLVVWVYYMDNVSDWTINDNETVSIAAAPTEEIDAIPNVESAVVAQPINKAEAPNEAITSSGEIVDASAIEADNAAVSSPESAVVDAPLNGIPSEPLVLSLKEACWVSIKTMDGQKFFEALLPAGTVQGFNISAPFKLKVGNASAATAQYLKKPLDLATYTRGSVARLTVNQQMLEAAVKKEDMATSLNQSVVDTVNAAPEAVKPLMANTGDLVVKTTSECWVSVKDALGKTVFQQLLPANSLQAIDVQKPFRLTIGNASEAQASFQKQALDLESNKQHNVARLKVE